MENNMAAVGTRIPESRLLVYRVGSADKIYSEVNQRELRLRHDPGLGPLLRGEVPECGTECFANLGQVILEYVMACERCEDGSVLDEFGGQIGTAFGAHVRRSLPGDPPLKQALRAMLCVLNSQEASFTVEQSDDALRFVLDSCPLCLAAKDCGIGGCEAQAHRVLYALYRALVHTLDPGLFIDLPAHPHAPSERLAITLVPA